MRYSIDTSALMDGWVRNYPPDVFPDIWENLDKLIAEGHLRASEEVLEELRKKDEDGLYRWAKSRDALIVPIDSAIQLEVTDILRGHPKLIDQRRNRSGADRFVIALAGVNDCAVVSGEAPTTRPDRPHIPDVCLARGIEHINFITLVRRERLTYRL